MKRLIWGSVVALLLMSGPAAATCLYQGVPYSEGARVCMYRTMFMCRGERWIKTAERCWEKYANPQGVEDFSCTRSSPTQSEISQPVSCLPASEWPDYFVSVPTKDLLMCSPAFKRKAS